MAEVMAQAPRVAGARVAALRVVVRRGGVGRVASKAAAATVVVALGEAVEGEVEWEAAMAVAATEGRGVVALAVVAMGGVAMVAVEESASVTGRVTVRSAAAAAAAAAREGRSCKRSPNGHLSRASHPSPAGASYDLRRRVVRKRPPRTCCRCTCCARLPRR